jgi:diguanylate cyclase (GGDEF)-like protein/PAS domain S-box-containing protein
VQLYNLTAVGGAWLVAALMEERAAVCVELETLNHGLEVRVAERTAVLSATIEALHEERIQRQTAETRYRVLFTDSASVMLLIEPESGRIVDANEAAARYYGWSIAELSALHIAEINTASAQVVQSQMQRATKRGKRFFHFHVRHRRAAGDVRDVEVYSGLVTLQGQALLHSIVHDVTDAKRAVAWLRASEKRFRAAFDGAPLGLVEVSLDPADLGRYLRVNQAFCDITGYSREELLALEATGVSQPQDRNAELELLAQAAGGELRTGRRQKRLLRKDGRSVWVSTNFSLLASREGKPYGLEHVEDITERKEAQELMDLVFDVSIDALCMASLDGILCRANPAWTRMLGWTTEDLAAIPYLELVHPDDRERTAALMRSLADGRPVLGLENRCRCRDGSYRWLQWNVAPLLDRRLIVANVRDITDRRRSEAELAHRAVHDGLTGLPNRTLFHDRLKQGIRSLERGAGALALWYIDLDRFKEINDSLGHEAGDQVLVEVGRRLTVCVRAVDTVARLAGDEFVIVCPGFKDDTHLTVLGERILSTLRAPLEIAGACVELAASIGVTVTRSHTVTPEKLLHEADTAMYDVKRRGRNSWRRYSPALEHHTLRRTAIQQDLRQALEHDGLRLHYQPVIDLADGRIVGVEALLRLQHPTRGLLGADEFIDVAEESDIILPIGEWVIKEACRQAADWNHRLRRIELAINISGRQASRGRVAEQVLGVLSTLNLDPALLCIEMTERILIESGSSVINDLRTLTESGAHLALDDFGTGYSSLTYLKRFPIDTVKIDRSFVADLGHSRSDTAIVQAITSLARSLRLATVAEGVERQSQRDMLCALDCQRAQGFLFYRPMPAEELTRLLDSEIVGVGERVSRVAG